MSTHLGGLDRVAANERHVHALAKSHPTDAAVVLECECTRAACDRRIDLTPSEYEPIRSSAARYAICPHEAHVDPAVDRLVERHSAYWVVERETAVEVLEFFAPTATVPGEAPPGGLPYDPLTLARPPDDEPTWPAS